MMTLEEIVEGAVGPFDEFCDGYGNSGATGNSYISVLKLETGTVEKRLDHILEFSSILEYLIRKVRPNKNYPNCDLLQLLRLLKRYRLLKDPQLELFK